MEDFIKKRENEPLDIEKIIKDIRDDIQEKKEMGLLYEEEIQRIKELDFEPIFLSLASDVDASGNISLKSLEEIKDYLLKPSRNLDELQDLYTDKNMWNIDEDYPIKSHRSGIKGFIIPLVKKILRPVIKLYTDPIFYRQKLINYYFMNIMASSYKTFFDLKNLENFMISKLDSIERDLTFIRDRQKILEDYLEEVEDKLEEK